jgi:hypothetical protein
MKNGKKMISQLEFIAAPEGRETGKPSGLPKGTRWRI